MTDSPASQKPALPCDIAPYVPHRHGMCLLDTLLDVGDEYLHAEVTPRQDDLFAHQMGVPGWVGLEWLAQAVAAWAGVQAVMGGDKPNIGFLLGTRRYQCLTPQFAFGQPVRIEVTLDFRADNGLGAFSGQLLDSEGRKLASATLNVFQPESKEALDAIQSGNNIQPGSNP
ncbi:hotdog family protein [Halomonas sp. 18H]|nr:hotdog family protein [Halomonas sp. 18H]MCW4153179.1 hotdog family protein [Halomonas sp. 18H]